MNQPTRRAVIARRARDTIAVARGATVVMRPPTGRPLNQRDFDLLRMIVESGGTIRGIMVDWPKPASEFPEGR